MDKDIVNVLNESECLQVVEKALKATNKVILLSYRIERGSRDLVGYMGEYYRLLVEVADKSAASGVQQLRYFIKSIPRTDEYHKAACERMGCFRKEALIYTDILPHIQQYASTKLYAECYYERPDIMVLEDLSALPKHFQHTKPKEIYTLRHHHVVLEHLARLHTASIAWELREGVNIGEQFKDILVDQQMAMTNEWYVAGVKGILFLAKRQLKLKSAQVQEFIQSRLFDILCQAEKLTKPSTELRNVLCHHDTWDRNIFYQFNSLDEPTDCLIVDFQLTVYGSPTLDVNFFLHVTTTQQRRAEVYEQLLDYYFQTFQACCQRLELPDNLLPRAEFQRDSKRTRVAALIMLAICEPLMKMPDGLAHAIQTEDQQRFDYYMNCERDELFVRVMAADPLYEAVIMAPIDELIEFLMANEDMSCLCV